MFKEISTRLHESWWLALAYAGGFAAGGPHARLADALGLEWPIRPADPAWVVHLPDGRSVTQWADPAQWQAERVAAFPQAEKFWQTHEMLADISWDISSRPFPWPPESARDLLTLAQALRPKTFRALPYLLRTMGSLAPTQDPMFKAFLDGQLLISAQTTADEASALYGSAALDLPRRGVNHVQGGIGSLADTLVSWIRSHGGDVLFRWEGPLVVIQLLVLFLAVALFVVASRHYDMPQFLGLRQASTGRICFP